MTKITVADIDSLLPQTQCRKCSYAGCKPYAEAILAGEKISRCAPGSLPVLFKLADLLSIEANPYIEEVLQNTSIPKFAFIRETECIGCTKCLQACPVDAIVGARKLMHTVIQAECTGCELCVPACPVDCIDLIPDARMDAQQQLDAKQYHFRHRYEARAKRLEELSEIKNLTKMEQDFKTAKPETTVTDAILNNPARLQAEIQAAVLRVKEKKIQSKETTHGQSKKHENI